MPLDAVDLEHLESFGEKADLVGAAQSWNRGIVFLVGDLAHRVHDRRERPQNAVANHEIGREADGRGDQRDGDAGDQEIGERRLGLTIDLKRVVPARAAERAEFVGEAGDLIVQIEDRNEPGASADAQQEQ